MHLVSELVLGLEGELTKETQNEDEVHPAESADTEEPAMDVRFNESSPEVALFDSLTSEAEDFDTHVATAVDEEWFTNHLSASFTQGGPVSPPLRGEDF